MIAECVNLEARGDNRPVLSDPKCLFNHTCKCWLKLDSIYVAVRQYKHKHAHTLHAHLPPV